MVGIAFCGTLFRPAQLVLLTNAVTVDARGPVLGLTTACAYAGLALGSAIGTVMATSLGLGTIGVAGLGLLLMSWLCIRTIPRFDDQVRI